MKTTRMTTLRRRFGASVPEHALSRADYSAAVDSGRVLSIKADEFTGALYGEPGHRLCNVELRLVFPAPIPAALVIGIRPEHLL